jgi:hypothetical protein
MPDTVIILLANTAMSSALGNAEVEPGEREDRDDLAAWVKAREECCCS